MNIKKILLLSALMMIGASIQAMPVPNDVERRIVCYALDSEEIKYITELPTVCKRWENAIDYIRNLRAELIQYSKTGNLEEIKKLVINPYLAINYCSYISGSKKDRQTALATACLHGHPEIVECLLKHRADPNKKCTPIELIDHSANIIKSPATYVLDNMGTGRLACLQALCAYGADVNDAYAVGGEVQKINVLHCALADSACKPDIIRCLIENKADVNTYATFCFGTPLHLFFNHQITMFGIFGEEQKTILRFLMQQGANPHASYVNSIHIPATYQTVYDMAHAIPGQFGADCVKIIENNDEGEKWYTEQEEKKIK